MGRDTGHPDLAARGTNLAVDQLEKGGLASTAGTNQEGEFTRLQSQMDVIDGAPGPINPGHRPELDDWAHFSVGGNGEVSESLERKPLRLVGCHERRRTRRQHPDLLFGRSRP